jgi:NTE family protein
MVARKYRKMEQIIPKPVDRIALCLSGGGYRAALFHLGALRRLNELGVLSRVATVASVSGGSILAAHLATRIRPWPESGTAVLNWEERVENPFLHLVKRNIRTWPVAKRFLPWNWFRPSTQVKTLEASYRKHLTDLSLPDLPERPSFTLCGTDMTYGVNWCFQRNSVGSYLAGYEAPDATWPLAQAVAASSCFPPVFAPMPIGKNLVSDGGLYDNLGLEPAKNHGIVLVSDGGAPFVAGTPREWIARWKAYLRVSGKQAGSLRKRMLIGEFARKERSGAYWGISSAVSRYGKEGGYSKVLATEIISRVRTDLDAFSDAEIAVLMNHGYLLAEAAVSVHAPGIVKEWTEKRVPHSEWTDEGKVRDALKKSSKRMWFGRFGTTN